MGHVMLRKFSILLFLSGVLLLVGCKDPEPVRIGFVGELTSRSTGLGVSGRDGFLLAIEEANRKGGIEGRKIEPLVRDIRMHNETALHAVRSLVDEHVSAIVGPMTSQTAVAIVPELNRAGIPLVSPTVSTNELTGIDDFFFRVYYTNAQAARLLAQKLSAQGVQKIAAIYDLGNRAYTADWVNFFQEALAASGHASVERIPFEMRSDTLFLELAKEALQTVPDGILILANAVDTAMICQQLTKLGSQVPRYATGWSYSDDLLQFGGKSVEGLTIIQSANLTDPSPAVQAFNRDYRERYRTEPNFPALHAYDATRMVLAALAQTAEPAGLREELLQMDRFSGLQVDLSVDAYGDLRNPSLHLARISAGQFLPFD